MALSSEVRKLANKWATNTGWPKRLEWIEIDGIRGWSGQRVDFRFPLVAIVGENGSGKTTVLQATAACYGAPDPKSDLYASDFFPDTPFERIENAQIRYAFREGERSETKSVRKPSDRWRGNPDRPERRTRFIDLRRIQPLGARVGFAKMLKSGVSEGTHNAFDEDRLSRFSYIMGRKFEGAGVSTTSADDGRLVPVVTDENARTSGFHHGAGIITTAEFLANDFPRYSLVLIDEIETSLHPRTQRRLLRDLARIARINECQFIFTTHSPYILEELPPEGRIYILNSSAGRSIVTGVSPEFAMTQMDEEQHPEIDVYVEDRRAEAMVSEILVSVERDLLPKVQTVAYGTASVGNALGIMASQSRFPRPTVVFLDGDQSASAGCHVLPGDEAPEWVVFEGLKDKNWPELAQRLGRSPSEVIDALNRAMSESDHHQWVKSAADRLFVGSDMLWQTMCAVWATSCATDDEKESVVDPIKMALNPA